MIDEQTEKPRNSFWKELPILLGVAILVAVLVRAFVLQTFFIPSPSMENTLKIDDRVLVNKLVYDFRSPHRGEVIVFKAPTEWSGNPDGEDFIKRVIGVGGDHVVCCDRTGGQDRLVINGKPVDEPFIFPGNKPADQDFDITVPKGRLWVMGDHREASGDSLEHWQQSGEDITVATIPEGEVVGRAFTIFWPVSRATWLSVPKQFEGIPNP
ncbi:signal peptidase I [Micromonospora chalcea]|uniref:Signal peptidase I n=1 Tax=Micromonospora chalcea TaxID=1874 RepID=A0ABX9Y5U8_MICCH|nr:MULTISPECIES: signal peptidase I [Micromonospora]AXO33710.1 signal peptidase I [Micromonospora sp. B006]EWM65442.1 signal peptidase I [Micromonospora sp. M42]MBC8989159.1 signal peptidase I [Micromonospora chalcea]MBP1781452.1 signal peptidase I [Micromonospora sp. HB375]MBQ1060083.1 signal peptidase I [Micromonospora sp. C41]